MPLDLNGSAAGTDHTTSYIDDAASIGIVAPGVVVGSGSSSSNTDKVTRIRISGNWASGDTLQIGSLPAGLVLSGDGIPRGARSWTGLARGDVFIERSSAFTTITDLMWQTALQGVQFSNNTPLSGADGVTAPTRTIVVATMSTSSVIASASTTIHIDNPPAAVADTGTAVEAGGASNAAAGSRATGNVLVNDIDPDAGDALVVSAVSFGTTSGMVGSALAGACGSLLLNADGSYTYTVNNDNPAVQALRTAGDTLVETFNYTVKDAAGATRTSTLTLTVQGANDAPVAYRVVTSGRYILNEYIATDTSLLLTNYKKDLESLLEKFDELGLAQRTTWTEKMVDYYALNNLDKSSEHQLATLKAKIAYLSSQAPLHDIAAARQEFEDRTLGAQRYVLDAKVHEYDDLAVREELSKRFEKILEEGKEFERVVQVSLGMSEMAGFDVNEELVVHSVRQSPRGENDFELPVFSGQKNMLESYIRSKLGALTDPENQDAARDADFLVKALTDYRMALISDSKSAEGKILRQTAALDAELRHYFLESDDVEGIGKHQQAYSDLSNRMQFLRFAASIPSVVNVPARIKDAVDRYQQYKTVLGDTPEAESLRKYYLLKTYENSFGAFYNLATPSQLFAYYAWKGGATFEKHLALAFKPWDSRLGNAFLNVPDRTPIMELLKTHVHRDNTPFSPVLTKRNFANLVYQLSDLSGPVVAGIALAGNLNTIEREGLTYSSAYQAVTNGWAVIAGLTLSGSDAIGWFRDGDRYKSAIASRAQGVLGKVNFGLLAVDVAGQAVMAGLSDGANWGPLLNTLWNAGVSGLMLGQAISPMAAVAAQLVAPNFANIQNALRAYGSWHAMDQAGLSEDAAHQWKVYRSESLRALPGVFGSLVAMGYDASVGTHVWTREDFENSARQRIASLDAETATNRPKDAAVAIAKQFGLRNVWVIGGEVIDYGVNPNDFQVAKPVSAHHVVDGVSADVNVAFYDSSVPVTGKDNLANPLPVKLYGIDLNNATGDLMTYVIAPPKWVQTQGTQVTVRTANIEIDVSQSSPDSLNQFIIHDPQVLIRGGPGIDLYFLMQALQPVFDSQGNLVAGYIIDNSEANLVSFRDAKPSDPDGGGYVIHSELDLTHVRLYPAIAFEGSQYNDRFTRYGVPVGSDAELTYRGGGGADFFDLRGGNNVLQVGADAVVHFDLTSTPAGATPSELFANRFTAANTNDVDLSNASGGGWFEVWGHSAAVDILRFGGFGSGLSFTRQLSPATVDGHEVPASAYLVTDLSDSTQVRGFFSRDVDQLHGTQAADRIDVDAASNLQQFAGHGGADEVTIDKVGFTLIEDAGHAVITLKSGAQNALVTAASGNTVHIETVDGAAADDVVTVRMKGTAGQLPVIVEAGEATSDVQAFADSGGSDFTASRGDSTIVITATADHVTVNDIDNALRLGDLNIAFLDAGDDLFDPSQLYSFDADNNKVEGFQSELLRDGVTIKYDTTWHTASGNEVEITIYSTGADLSVGAYNPAGSGLTPLDQLIAHPQPLPIPA